MPQAAHSINVKHTCTLKRHFELVQHYLPDSDTATFIYVTLGVIHILCHAILANFQDPPTPL